MKPYVSLCNLVFGFCVIFGAGAIALAAPTKIDFDRIQPEQVKITDAALVDGFTKALTTYAEGMVVESQNEQVEFWLRAFRQRGVDPAFLSRKLSLKESEFEGDRFAAYRKLTIETYPSAQTETAAVPVALHAFRIDVVEDYDDVFNDDIYCYFIMTHDDVMWGKVTQIYRGLDEGTSVFLSPEDRGLFGPSGEKLVPKNHLIVDYGMIESDGDDISQLHKISDAIVDLALIAVSIYDPQAGAAAAQARAETQNLLKLVIDLDDDDRLVTDTLKFTPELMNTMLSGSTINEFARFHDHETVFTHFAYRMNFRLLR